MWPWLDLHVDGIPIEGWLVGGVAREGSIACFVYFCGESGCFSGFCSDTFRCCVWPWGLSLSIQ